MTGIKIAIASKLKSYRFFGIWNCEYRFDGRLLTGFRYISFPSLLERGKPVDRNPISVNLRDEDSTFAEFTKKLYNILFNGDLLFSNCLKLLNDTKVSFNGQTEALETVLGAHKTINLVLLLDAVTYLIQCSVKDEYSILLDVLSSILTTRPLVVTSENSVDTTPLKISIRCISRVKHYSGSVKHLIFHINREVRIRVDDLLSVGDFVSVTELLLYKLHPKVIDAIVHTIVFKLPRMTYKDYVKLPRFLFSFKIHNNNVISAVLAYAAKDPIRAFGGRSSEFESFYTNLSLFDNVGCYATGALKKPSQNILSMMQQNVNDYTSDNILFLLSALSGCKRVRRGWIKDYDKLIHSILAKAGFLKIFTGHEALKTKIFKGTESAYESFSYPQLTGLLTFLSNVSFFDCNFTSEGDYIRSIIFKTDYTDIKKLHEPYCGNLTLSATAKELCRRLVKSEDLKVDLRDIDPHFRSLDVIGNMIRFLNKCIYANISRVYVDCIIDVVKCLLSSTPAIEFDLDNVHTIISIASTVNIRLMAILSKEIWMLAMHCVNVKTCGLTVAIDALKFLGLSVLGNIENGSLYDNDLLRLSSDVEHLVIRSEELFRLGKISEKVYFNNLTKILSLISRIFEFSDKKCLPLLKTCDSLSKKVSNSIKNDANIVNVSAMKCLLQLPADGPILSHISEILELSTNDEEGAKKFSGLPMKLIPFVVYYLSRYEQILSNSFCGTEDVSLILTHGDRICSLLSDLSEVVSNKFSRNYYQVNGRLGECGIKHASPWDAEVGLQVLFQNPREPYDIFIYEKIPEVDKFFYAYEYSGYRCDGTLASSISDKESISSLYELKKQLLCVSSAFAKIQLSLSQRLRFRNEEPSHNILRQLYDSMTKINIAIIQCILTIAMHTPILRSSYLPRRHTDIIVEAAVARFNKKNILSDDGTLRIPSASDT